MPTSPPSETLRAKTALAVMARYPEPGRVKTRLAKSIGAHRATDLYRAFLLDIEARFAGGSRALIWMYEPTDSPFASLLSPGSICLPQIGEGLGERMRNCFETLLGSTVTRGELKFDRVIMIGADVPHVRDSSIEEAEAGLADNDVILGPSDDGGYYLIALRRAVDVFSMVEMGAERVFEQTLAAVRAAGLKACVLSADFDVDVEADLWRLRDVLRSGDRAPLPRTLAALDAGSV